MTVENKTFQILRRCSPLLKAAFFAGPVTLSLSAMFVASQSHDTPLAWTLAFAPLLWPLFGLTGLVALRLKHRARAFSAYRLPMKPWHIALEVTTGLVFFAALGVVRYFGTA